ncbi:MAG: hypothetical protein ABW171_11255 [Steroidobacter sp.]
MFPQINKSRALTFAVVCAGMLLPLAGHAAEDSAPSAPVQATWKTQEIRYSYSGFTTAYNCDAAESRLKAILRALGAHEQTRVSATGCNFNRPSRNFFITITTAMPVPLAEAPVKSQADTSKEELLKRLGVQAAQLDQTFPAEWKTVELSRNRKLDIEPGDCELIEGLKNKVLPQLGLKIVSSRVSCIPRQVSIQPPELTVSALVPMAKPDEPKPKS